MAGKKGLKIVGFVIIAVLAGAGYMFGPEIASAYRAGLFNRQEAVKYQGDSLENLKRLHTALMLYHDSEGQFPLASGWMDAIQNRLQTADLEKGEGAKKLHDPALGQDPNVYGFAMNSDASGKFKDDLPDQGKTLLVFSSSDTSRNAYGSPNQLAPKPPRPGGNLAISIDGTVFVDGKPEPSPASNPR